MAERERSKGQGVEGGSGGVSEKIETTKSPDKMAVILTLIDVIRKHGYLRFIFDSLF
jgi:hypothetical protein